jgi:hypothetical protein
MLTSILTPVVHGKHSRFRWFALACLYSLANCLAATLLGFVLFLVGGAIGRSGGAIATWSCGAAFLLALLYLPREMGWSNWPPLIESTRQVPRTWACDYPRWGTALLFGLGLGSGIYTRIVVPTFYLLLVWPLLMPGSRWAVLIWLAYGFARSSNVWWLASVAPLGEPIPYAFRITATLIGRATWMYRVNALLMWGVAAGLLASVKWQ